MSSPDIREPHIAALRDAIGNYGWNAVYSLTDDIDLRYCAFIQILQSLIEKHIPFKKVTKRSYDPWFVTPRIN